MTTLRFLSPSLMVLAMIGCARYPTGPSVLALPGMGATFEQFRSDDAACQMIARHTSGGASAQDAAPQGAEGSAVAGGAIGAAGGSAERGAAIGAGSGLVLGSATATTAYGSSGWRAQDRYDNAYVQCMYAKGHQVPVSVSVAAANRAQVAPAYVAPAPAEDVPPAVSAYPPPNTAPPPGY